MGEMSQKIAQLTSHCDKQRSIVITSQCDNATINIAL